MQIPVEALPFTSMFYLDYVREWPRVERFYSRSHSLESIEFFARERVSANRGGREVLAGVLKAQQDRWNVSPAPAERLGTGAVAVISGQQAGLFTGPMYSVLKALTAVKIARHLRNRGVDAVPVFWIASEDHDREEIEWTGIPGRDGAFHRIAAELAGEERSPAGWMRFTDDIQRSREECIQTLPATGYATEVRAMLQDAYRPGVSPVEAFARMMGRIFEGTELILVDPLEPGFRHLSERVMGTVMERSDDIRAAVLERTGLVSTAGYPSQVRVDDDFTGFFAYRGKSRQVLRSGETAPAEALSPNALLRPVVQDSIFPTAAIVGGAAEIAYFAQAGAVYECLGIAMPPIVPRISATILEPPQARAMKKHGFGMEDIFGGPDHLRRKAVGAIHGTEEFDRTRNEIVDSFERIRPIVQGMDLTLGGAMDNALRKMRYQVDRLETRFVNAELRRNETLDRQLQMLSSHLFPQRKLQERAVNVTAFLARYGSGLIGLLDDLLDLDSGVHQVVAP